MNGFTKSDVEQALLLLESVDMRQVQRAVDVYAPDLTDDEVEAIGRDPLLIAYALAAPSDRCVVTIGSITAI